MPKDSAHAFLRYISPMIIHNRFRELGRRAAVLLLTATSVAPALRAQTSANVWASVGTRGDYVVKNFRFVSGDVLPELRLHYTTLGAPRKDAKGMVRNAVLVLHGTGGAGTSFLNRNYAGELFAPGKLLDSSKYYIILPDGIGHGASSKPSDGLRAKFPKYTYDDMVESQYQLLTQHLSVNHVRLIMGTSMGCMQGWVWGYQHADFMDGLAPFACVPSQIAGRNRMMRTMAMDAIRSDPTWNGGNYTAQPSGLRTASMMLYIMGSAPLLQQRVAATRDAADSVIRAYLDDRMRTSDANDFLYQFDASREYDPSPFLAKISAPALYINSADDLINPPELGMAEKFAAKIAHAKFIMIPISEQTRGHGTHSLPLVWGGYLRDFLSTLPER